MPTLSLLEIMEELAKAHDKKLEKEITPAEKVFLEICRNAEQKIKVEIERLTRQLSFGKDARSMEMDLMRAKGTLANITLLYQQHLVNSGVFWATHYYPAIIEQSIKLMNEFKRKAGITLDTFTEIDALHLKTSLGSWKESLIVAGDDYKRFVSKTITESIMAGGLGGQKALAEKFLDNEGLLPTTNLIRESRAKWQARNELIRISRETNILKDADETYFRMSGPVDNRCTPICLKYVGFIKTKKEWLDISPDAMTIGLHFGCRHKWYPVRKEWLPPEEQEAMEGNKRILYNEADRNFIEKADVPNKFLTVE